MKQIPGFDVMTAYEAILKNAYVPPPSNSSGVGRVCLPSYITYGYIPQGVNQTDGSPCNEVVSRAQSYYQSDFAIAQSANVLGDVDNYNKFLARTKNYPEIFNEETGFFRSRRIETLDWTVPFDQYAWGGDYMESGPWQYRFSIPYDPIGLSSLYSQAGLDLCNMLSETQTTKPVFHIGTFEGLIKEQTEMVEQCWGQYAHNDQPVHHVLYMFGAIDSLAYR